MISNGEGAAPTGVEDVGRIADAIRALSRDGDGLPSERRLAEILEVKRHQLRKALASLRTSGELDPPKARKAPAIATGQFGVDLAGLSNPLEVIELRLILEPNFARLASIRGSGVEIARVTSAATTPPDADVGQVDLAFHRAIAAASRNNLGAALYDILRKVGTDARVRIAGRSRTPCRSDVQRRDAEHRRIADAIAARDPDAAEAEMRSHLSTVQELIMERANPGRIGLA